jgi:hypothetical protein
MRVSSAARKGRKGDVGAHLARPLVEVSSIVCAALTLGACGSGGGSNASGATSITAAPTSSSTTASTSSSTSSGAGSLACPSVHRRKCSA